MSIFLILNLIMKKTYQDNVFHFDNFLNYFFRCQPKDVSSMCFVKLMNCRQCDRVFIWFFFVNMKRFFFLSKRSSISHYPSYMCTIALTQVHTKSAFFFLFFFVFLALFSSLSSCSAASKKVFGCRIAAAGGKELEIRWSRIIRHTKMCRLW